MNYMRENSEMATNLGQLPSRAFPKAMKSFRNTRNTWIFLFEFKENSAHPRVKPQARRHSGFLRSQGLTTIRHSVSVYGKTAQRKAEDSLCKYGAKRLSQQENNKIYFPKVKATIIRQSDKKN